MISNSAKYWIWLSLCLGFNNPKIKRISQIYNDITDFYNGKEQEWILCGIFTANDLDNLRRITVNDAELIINECRKLNYNILSIDDVQYPMCLKNIYAPPAVIYIEGKIPDIDNILSIAIVGTRKASIYGIKTSYEMGYNLSKAGVIVVSGGALGVDCASHKGVLQADGRTVCVLGCGINYNYLNENAQMRKMITNKGAVISEYPPNSPPKNYHFPARNRIISALSNGVLVIEAGLKSGSLITVNCALEQGKDVFAVMADINSFFSKGSNALIKDGAIPVTEFTDIINNYENLYAVSAEEEYLSKDEEIAVIPVKGKPPKYIDGNSTKNVLNNKIDNKKFIEDTKILPDKQSVEPKHKENIDLSANANKIYYILCSELMHIDEISLKSGLPVFKVLQSLTELELMGLIESQQGRKYKIV